MGATDLPAPGRKEKPTRIGRYLLHGMIARGGMARVHFGTLIGDAGFSRIVAIKRLHPQLAESEAFVSGLIDEAHILARVRHPHVVQTLDVVYAEGELCVVMEYIEGESLAKLLSRARHHGELPPRIAVGVMLGVLEGLHAAHEAKSQLGEPLCIVHRDVSPQNILVGVDGLARVVDFGIAKAAVRIQSTGEGQLKGKLAYMAPEQALSGEVTRQVDVFVAGTVLWEMLALRHLFRGENNGHTLNNVLEVPIDPPSRFAPQMSAALDRVVLTALERNVRRRYKTAREFSEALSGFDPAPAREIAEWVRALASAELDERTREVAEIELDLASSSHAPLSLPVRAGPVSASGVARVSELATTAGIEDGTLLSSESPIRSQLRRKKKLRTPLLLVALVCVVGAMAAVAIWRRAASRASNEAPASSGAIAPVTAPPVPSASVAAASPSVARPPLATSRQQPRVQPRAVPRARCNPPYVVDENGIRHLKRECM